MRIDNVLVIDNDGLHNLQSQSVNVNVSSNNPNPTPGSRSSALLRIEYFDAVSVSALEVYITPRTGPSAGVERLLTCEDVNTNPGVNDTGTCSNFSYYQDPLLEFDVQNLRNPSATGVIETNSDNPVSYTHLTLPTKRIV